MKLNKLRWTYGKSRSVSHGQTVARYSNIVRGTRIKLTNTASRQYCMVGLITVYPAVFAACNHSAAFIAFYSKLQNHFILINNHVFINLRKKFLHNFKTRSVSPRVNNSWYVMSALLAKKKISFLISIKFHTWFYKFFYNFRSLWYKGHNRFWVILITSRL